MALTMSGAGTQVLSGSNTYTGGTTVAAGTLAVAGNGALSASGSLNVAAGALFTTSVNNTFSISPSGAWSISGTMQGTKRSQTMPPSVTLNNGTMSGASSNFGTFLVPSAPPTTITASGSGNTINAGNIGMANTLILNTPQPGDAVAVSAILGSSSANSGGLTKSGSGLATLSANNIYTGGTTISAGTLAVLSGGSLGSGTLGITPGAVLDVSNFGGGGYNFSGVLSTGRTSSYATDINGTINLNGATLNLPAAATAVLTVSGSLGGSGAAWNYTPGSQVRLGGASISAAPITSRPSR